MVKQENDYLSFKKLDCRMPDCFENINKSVGFPKLWTMRKSRYEDAQQRMTSFSATESIYMNLGKPERTARIHNQLAGWTGAFGPFASCSA